MRQECSPDARSVSFPHCIKKKKNHSMVRESGKANYTGQSVIITLPRDNL